MRPTKMNVQLGYMGQGYLDPKVAVKTIGDLDNLKTFFAGFIPNGHVVWVMKDREWYVYDLSSDSFTLLTATGNEGPQGPQGEVGTPGAPGNSFRIDAECADVACLAGYCAEEVGFTVLVKGDPANSISDKLYFRLDKTPCEWSTGTDFNTGVDGDDGTATYFMFAYATQAEINSGTPSDIDVPVTADGGPPSSFTTNGVTWHDAPVVPATPTIGASMYMLKSESYKLNTFNTVPWAQPAVKIDGEEGRSAGIWTIWNDLKVGQPIDPPFNKDKMDNETDLKALLASQNAGWYDDVSSSTSPSWMAVSFLTIDKQEWKQWTVSRVAGEKPAYLVNGFKWHNISASAPIPNKPNIDRVKYGLTGGGIFTVAGSDGWYDNPQPIPPGSGSDFTLFQTVTTIPFTGQHEEFIVWSTPINMEGNEGPQGDGTAIWTIWSDHNSPSPPLKTLAGDYNTYTTDDELMTGLGKPADWYADAGHGVSPIWMATCIYVPGRGWTDWKYAKVKGEDGKSFKIDFSGSDDPWIWASSTNMPLSNGFAYLDVDGSAALGGGQLYFLNNAIKPTLKKNWSEPIAFGAGQAGATTYFYFKRAASLPAAPSAKPDDSDMVPGWYDAIPGGTGTVYMTSIVKDGVGNWGTWNTPIKIEGEDGSEGAGIWTIFTSKKTLTQAIATVDLPTGNPGAWNFTHVDGWIDDVGDNNANLGGEEPQWMAISRYDVINGIWLPWVLAKIKGEEPAYKVNAFRLGDALHVPAAPTQNITYGDGWDSGDAADSASGWSDMPMHAGSQRFSLYMSETIVKKDVSGSNWSIPVKLDANDGFNSGQWNLWWKADSPNADILPRSLTDSNKIIHLSTDGNGTIVLPSREQFDTGVWVDDIVDPGHYTYRAITNRIGFRWTPWDIIRVKGENGSDGNDGNQGLPGGTIIMVSESVNLTNASPERPSDETNPHIDGASLTNSDWVVSATGENAIHLAVMTFGYNTATRDSRWSVWRVSKIVGDEGIDGISIPPKARMIAGNWGDLVPYAWSIISNSLLENKDYIGSDGGDYDTGEVTLLPIMKFMGGRATPPPPRNGSIHQKTYSTSLVLDYKATQYPESISEYIKINPVFGLNRLVAGIDLSMGINGVITYRAVGVSGFNIFSKPLSGFESVRTIASNRYIYHKAVVDTLPDWMTDVDFSYSTKTGEEVGVALLYSEEFNAIDSTVYATWFEIYDDKLWLCFGTAASNPLPSSGVREVYTRSTSSFFASEEEYAVHTILTESATPPPPLPGYVEITGSYNSSARAVDISFGAATNTEYYKISWEWTYNGTHESENMANVYSAGTYSLHTKGQLLPSGTKIYVSVVPCNSIGCASQQPKPITV